MQMHMATPYDLGFGPPMAQGFPQQQQGQMNGMFFQQQPPGGW
jgi:hypothetical protein